MFALRFRFPADRYHATPWGRNVNEGDVAWPPEPWRLLRTLVGAYWRKGDHERWPELALARLIDALAETPPVYRLPEGAIHAHSRHYMPQRRGKTALIFDAFVRIPKEGMIVAAWPDVTLDRDSFTMAADLAAAIGYLGRAESWTECEALADWHGEPNCGPVAAGFSGDPVRVLAPLPRAAYAAQRARLIADEGRRISAAAKKAPTPAQLDSQIAKALRSKAGKDTLPERLSDAIALDTADYQDRGWRRPSAARELLYARAEQAVVRVAPRVVRRRPQAPATTNAPTVARYLLAGRPRPRVEDTVKIAETMRLAALAQFGWRRDASSGRRVWQAPCSISGHDGDGEPLRVRRIGTPSGYPKMPTPMGGLITYRCSLAAASTWTCASGSTVSLACGWNRDNGWTMTMPTSSAQESGGSPSKASVRRPNLPTARPSSVVQLGGGAPLRFLRRAI